MDNDSPPRAGAGDVPPDLVELGAIIRAYSEAAAGLQETHRALQEQVAQLSAELQAKNLSLSQTVAQVSSLKNYLASIIESSADGIVAIDLDRRVVAWNPAANLVAEISGKSNGRPEGRFILEAMTGPCLEMGMMLVRALREYRRFSGVEMRLVDVRGNTRVLSVSASPVRTAEEDGTMSTAGAVQIFSELTELRELEAKANRQDRLAALGEMAAGVAHEIRNPLGGIELYASTLRRKFQDGTSEHATCGKIMAAAASLNRIVTDMLVFARGRLPRARPVAIGGAIRQALELSAGELEERDIKLELCGFDDKGRYPLDPDQMTQAVLNVVQNAAQAMGGGGFIRITASEEKDEAGKRFLVLSFADSGPGIPDEAKEKVFNPFFTLRKDGTGLGLAIVHKIIQDHGGTVLVMDNVPKGAVVVFRLPAG